MLRQVADGVLVHESEFCQSNAVVVQGPSGVLLVDPGIVADEMVQLARDVRALGQPIVAGFATHPHWDHLLWHSELGSPPRYGTARCATLIRTRLAEPNFKDRLVGMIPPDIVEQVPFDLLGLIDGLPAGAERIPWDGPEVRIIEHQAHAPGHAALLIEERRVLIAGDMLSDILVPMVDVMNATDPAEDYLAGLRLLEDVAGDVDVVIPGHGSVAGGDQIRARIEQDRTYVHGLIDGSVTFDPRNPLRLH